MKTIHKVVLPVIGVAVTEMPVGSKVLSVGVQRGNICVWYLTDEVVDPKFVRREFRIAGTGHLLEDEDAENFVGTVQLHEGQLVFHVFDRGER